jgi:hypothetical protein
MAMAAAVPLVEAAMAEAPNILAAASMANELATKYGPKVSGAVNHLFDLGRKRKSAATYLKGLGTKKGLKRFITKDLGRGLKQSGQVIGEVAHFANDVNDMTQGGEKGGLVGQHANKIASAIGKGANHATRYHQLAEGYHDQGKSLVSPLKAYRF